MSADQDTSSEPKSGTYNGGCHCGRVKFTMTISPPIEDGKVTNCNCSICSIHGLMFVYPSDSDIEWHSGVTEMTGYKFKTERIVHSFCPTCGTSVLAKSCDPNFFAGKSGINVRTLAGIDLDTLNLHKFDGKSL